MLAFWRGWSHQTMPRHIDVYRIASLTSARLGFPTSRTVLAVAGKGFCVVASDTRLGLGYSIPSRKVSRILKM